MKQRQITAVDLQQRKKDGDRLVMVTAYDATFSRILEGAGVDILLVGDSLGMVVQGESNTLPVTLDQMIYHTRAVSRGAQRAHVVGDLPFMSYQISQTQALTSAGRLVQEGGAHAVKLEGGVELAASVEAIVNTGIPVMGHIGLTPQSVHRMGGFKVQGKDVDGARRLLDDARALERAGCYAIVLEGIPAELAARITSSLQIPTIGIGAGAGCDGQVLVCYDLLGMNPDFHPKFVKKYADLFTHITQATSEFVEDVRTARFPSEEHSFHSRALTQGPIAIVKGDVEDDVTEGIYGVPV